MIFVQGVKKIRCSDIISRGFEVQSVTERSIFHNGNDRRFTGVALIAFCTLDALLTGITLFTLLAGVALITFFALEDVYKRQVEMWSFPQMVGSLAEP